jgi:hypothetical protein
MTRVKSLYRKNILQNMLPEYKVLFLGQITEYHSSYFQAWWWLHNVMGMLASARTREFI